MVALEVVLLNLYLTVYVVNKFINKNYIIYKLYMSFNFIPLNNNGANNFSISSTRNRNKGKSLIQAKGAMPAKFYPSHNSNI